MSTAYIDTIDEGDLQATRDRTAIVVTYKLKGVTGSNATAIKVNAANDSNLPLLNAAHPTYSALRVTEKRVSLVDNMAVVAVTYSTATTAPGGDPEAPTTPVYRMSARVSQEQTNCDKGGIPIALGPNLDTPASVTVLKPVITMRVSRVEEGINPGVVAQTYVGKVNLTTWQSKPKGWWLCTGIEANSDDSGDTWRMDYDFELAQQGKRPGNPPASPPNKTLPWNPIAFYIDPATNQPPAKPFPGHADYVMGAEYYEVPSYDTIDFNTLNI